MSIEKTLGPILAKLSDVGKPQRKFMAELFSVLLGHQGRATFENLARYSCFTELTFRRWFARFFDWVEFNTASMALYPGDYIGVIDCTFVPKSGKTTYGLGKFWSSCAGKAQRGLEASVLACVNVATKQCFALEATQTPPGITPRDGRVYSRLSFYLEQLSDCLPRLTALTHWVGDGFYAKKEVFDLLANAGRHLSTRLRSDADLHHLWLGGRQPGQRGPNRKYDGKARFEDLGRWEAVGAHPVHDHISLYTQLLYSKRFASTLPVVLLLDTRSNKYVLLASTHLHQQPAQVAYYYHLRFQIELLFRDAKQFTGMTQCQARSQDKLDFHLNASLAAINVARLMLEKDESLHNSINALVRRMTDRRIWQVIYRQLGLEGLVDVNQFDSLQCQFWRRKAA
jgi:hypothetical protein